MWSHGRTILLYAVVGSTGLLLAAAIAYFGGSANLAWGLASVSVGLSLIGHS